MGRESRKHFDACYIREKAEDSQTRIVFRLDSSKNPPIQCLRLFESGTPGDFLELDDNFKRLIKELGGTINDSLSESDKVADVLARIRAAGYDLFLILEVTIGFNKRAEANVVHRRKITSEPQREGEFHLTNQDAQFLRALRIHVDEDAG